MSNPTKKVIVNGRVQDDQWTWVESDTPLAAAAGTPQVLPAATWLAAERATRDEVAANAPVGVWLNAAEDPTPLLAHLEGVALVAVVFGAFKEGRGYSSATLIRRAGFTGELRAVGDVLRDQLFYLKRVGFNAFAVRADRNIDDALKGLNDFSETYQAANDERRPLFRRRLDGGAA